MAIKNTTIRDMQKIKDKIIVFILYFLQTKDENYKKEALLHLENYAVFIMYQQKKRLATRVNLLDDLKNFILGNKGHIDTIPFLYKALEDKKFN